MSLAERLGLKTSRTANVPYITRAEAENRGVASECARLAHEGILVEIPFSGRRDPVGERSAVFAWAILP